MTTTLPTVATHPRGPVMSRTRVIGGLIALMGVVVAGVFGLAVSGAARSTFTFSPLDTSQNNPWHVAPLLMTTRWVDLVLGLVILTIGVEVITRQPTASLTRFGGASILFLVALLAWSCRTTGPAPINFVNITGVLIGASFISMVLIFGGLSGVMCERAGVVNIAIEGQFIAGAFFGTMVASVTNNFWLAALTGAVLGALLGGLLAFLALRYRSDQIIVGVVIVTMLGSLSSYLDLTIIQPYPNLNTGDVVGNFAIPLLSKIPIAGPVLFNQSGFFYLAVVLVAGISFGLFKTRWGLRVRAVGEHPKAAASVGISVTRVRYVNVILGGAIAGIGGVAFMATQGPFAVGYTSGLGYVALAALIFGRWRPSGVVVASILFGLSAYLANGLQSYNIPISGQILAMFPYVVTIAVVAGLIGRVRPPAADGQPYKRD